LGIGWLLDGWLGTKPLFMIVLMILGMGAGILNVVRASKELDKADNQKK
jgi:ATP synthase protein I